MGLGSLGVYDALKKLFVTDLNAHVIVDSIGTWPCIPPGTTPAIYNVTMTNANAEYSQALPSNCLGFMVQTQDGTAFRCAYVIGKVATPTAPYLTVAASSVYYETAIKLATGTLYFACASTGKIVEIVAWS